MNTYVFGNPVESTDSLPVQLLPYLQKEFPGFNFVHADPSENWWKGEKDVVMIDTVQGIDTVTIFDSLDTFQKQTLITPHDYDLLTDLLLMKKLGKIERVIIIGVPQIGAVEEIFNQLRTVVAQIDAGNHASHGAHFE